MGELETGYAAHGTRAKTARMETALLRVFLEVVKRGGFAAVARDSNVDPSSISRAIASLESELGGRLFQRTTRKLTLTEAGESFLARVGPVVDELERAREELASIGSEPSGTLRVTASVAFGQMCLVPLLPALSMRASTIVLERVREEVLSLPIQS